MENSTIHILLVEDNPGDARLLREMLHDADSLSFRLSHVVRLSEAREKLAEQPVDVVLLDLSLPDAHGMETVSRTLSYAPDAPIIVLTGLTDQSIALQAVQSGAQDYLIKGQVEGGLLGRSIRYALERKRLDRERLQLLEREREARETAEAAVRARDHVLRVVSHDLGNSLSAVRLHAMLLERALPAAEAATDAHSRIQAIRTLVEQMQRLRADLLDVVSLEAGRLSIEPREVDPEELATEAASMIADLAQEKGVTIRCEVAEGLPAVYADRQRLQQVLANLLGNAVKFTPSGGCITLRAEPLPERVRFSVADTGTGIAPEDLPRVFDSFWRAGRGGGGAGLGLAIARGIVEAHGGEIRADSEPGRGSTFCFTVPLAI